MKAFTELYTALNETTKTAEKAAALQHYFASASPADAAWAIYFLSGRKPRQIIATQKLQHWISEAGRIPGWLFEECYHAVGDLAETMALILPPAAAPSDLPLQYWIEERLYALRAADEPAQRDTVQQAWTELDERQRFVWNKLLTGKFRAGVSSQVVVQALAQLSGVETSVIAHRLTGDWEPTSGFYEQLLQPGGPEAGASQPYPFFLAYPLEEDPASLGEIQFWQAEWKWDGLRAQLIRRAGQTFLWSRNEELITGRFPELDQIAAYLPDGTVIDGEILPWQAGRALPFSQLQRRMDRKSLSKKLLAELPAVLLAYDLLEYGGHDIRPQPLRQRRMYLAELVKATAASALQLSPIIEAASWPALEQQRQTCRERQVEGLMLKRLDSPYRAGRQQGDWWVWEVPPLTIDAVLIYAQPGQGQQAHLFAEYTFAVWNQGELAPIAKTSAGLSDAEIRRLDRFVRQNTIDRFGPVRHVKPQLVFELAFESIQRSSRHKSGVVVRAPTVQRWRTDKTIHQAGSLDTIKAMLPGEAG